MVNSDNLNSSSNSSNNNTDDGRHDNTRDENRWKRKERTDSQRHLLRIGNGPEKIHTLESSSLVLSSAESKKNDIKARFAQSKPKPTFFKIRRVLVPSTKKKKKNASDRSVAGMYGQDPLQNVTTVSNSEIVSGYLHYTFDC